MNGNSQMFSTFTCNATPSYKLHNPHFCRRSTEAVVLLASSKLLLLLPTAFTLDPSRGLSGTLPSSLHSFSLPPTPNSNKETPEEATRRFEIECEFVQSLANPHYLNYLAQRGYFKEEYFVNYLRYLLYWRRPEYAETLKYPQCLYFLEALQSAEFRESIASTANAKYIEDQQMLQWHFYIRKRQRLSQFSQELEQSEEAGSSQGTAVQNGGTLDGDEPMDAQASGPQRS